MSEHKCGICPNCKYHLCYGKKIRYRKKHYKKCLALYRKSREGNFIGMEISICVLMLAALRKSPAHLRRLEKLFALQETYIAKGVHHE